MVALWWLGMGAIALAVMTVLYIGWWLFDRLISTNDGQHQRIERKDTYVYTDRGLRRKS